MANILLIEINLLLYGFDLAYYDVAVQQVSHFTTDTPHPPIPVGNGISDSTSNHVYKTEIIYDSIK